MTMNVIRNVLAIAGKELLVLSKDRGVLVQLFLLPLLLSSVIGSVFSSFMGAGESDEPTMSFEVFLVDEDAGMYAGQIVAILEDIDELNIEKVDTATEADERIADGQALAAIIIPAGFSDQIDAYEPTQVQVILDPAQEQGASIISGIMNRVVDQVVLWGEVSYGIKTVFDESGVLDGAPPEMRQAAEAQTLGAILTQVQTMQQNPVITIEEQNLEGVEETAPVNLFGFFVPNFAVMFAFFLMGVIATTILKEKEEGSFRRLIASPLSRGAIIAGKMIAYMLVILLQVAVLFGVANLVFDMPLGDSWEGLLLVSFMLALAASAMGMLLASWAKTSSQAESVGFILTFGLAGLGGCIAELSPDSFMGKISLLTPQRHAALSYYGLLNDGAGLVDVWSRAGILFGFAAVAFLIAMWQFKFE
jgi:ABC-2 type transport system permease protein